MERRISHMSGEAEEKGSHVRSKRTKESRDPKARIPMAAYFIVKCYNFDIMFIFIFTHIDLYVNTIDL